MLSLLLTAAISIAAVQDNETEMDQIRPRGWSVPHEGLSIQLRIDGDSTAPGSDLRTKLFVRAVDGGKHAKLLQGRIIYTFVPITNEPGNKAVSTFEHFSGAGGLDDSGKTGAEYQLTAPLTAGKYYLFATVLSTGDEVKSFF